MKIPKYRKHSSADRGFVEHGGKRHYLPGAYNSPESIAAYKRFIADVCGGAMSPVPTETPATIRVLVDSWLEYADQHYPGGTRGEAANCRAAVQPLMAMFEALPPTQFTPKRLKELQLEMAAAKLTRGYINGCVGRIRRMFRWAASEELVPVTIYESLKTVAPLGRNRTAAKESEPRRPVPIDSVTETLKELSPQLRNMVTLQRLTGVRSQSVCHAKPEQFDTSKTPWEWRPKHKTEHHGTILVVFIGPAAREILEPLLKATPPGEYLFQPREQRGNKRYGKHYKSASYAQAIDRAVIRVNAEREKQGLEPIPSWTPHQLRHAKATMVRETYGLEASQATMGHETIDATQIYAERQMNLARKIAEETS